MHDSVLTLPPHLGEEVLLEASIRYNLSDPFTIWVVEEEAGDLFLYDPKDPNFLPIFIDHAKVGDLIIGRGSLEETAYGFYFLSPRHTTLRKIPFQALLTEMSKDSVLKDTFIQVFEHHLNEIFSLFPSKEGITQKKPQVWRKVRAHAW